MTTWDVTINDHWKITVCGAETAGDAAMIAGDEWRAGMGRAMSDSDTVDSISVHRRAEP